MKKILVLGTGAPQADLIRACKERGWEVYACSYRAGDPGEKLADHFALINIVDVAAVAEYASENRIDAVYSAGSDIAMPTAFTVSERLGLPHFCPAQSAVTCNTKTLLRQTLGKDFAGNIPFQMLRSKEETVEIPYPLMVKPEDSQGQRGVFCAHDQEELTARFDESMHFSRSKKLILEKKIEGDEISVNTFSHDGKLLFFLPSERVVWPGLSGGIIHRHVLPGKWSDDVKAMERVRDLVERTLRCLEILNGPAYFQIMIDREGSPYLIEVTPRLDGCHMWRLIRFATGVDLMALTVDALEGKMPTEPPDYTIKAFETEFFCQAPDTVFCKDRFEPGDCAYLEWYYEEGETVHRMNGYKEKCGYAMRPLIQK